MKQKFRLFVQKHDMGTYTVTVPGVQRVSLVDDWDDAVPAVPRLASYGLLVEEVKEDIEQALAKWLAKADPTLLHRYSNYREGQYLEKVEVELRPAGRDGKKRHDKLKIKFSLLLTKQEDGQYLVTVPKLSDPPHAFYCYKLEELKEVTTRELSTYFSDYALEDLLDYEYQRQEFLDEVEVSFTPLKPQKEKKQKDDDGDYGFWALKSAGVNLSARVKEGKLLHAYRRDREVNEILQVLAGERNNCVILTGASGAGKTAIVHEVARRIHEGNCPPELRKRQVWQTSANQLIAGCSYIGEWQEKLQNVVDEVKKRRHILHVDDITGLLEAGRWSKGDENMALFLKPFIADGTMVIIGESTPERYRVGENKDSGFLRQFRTLEVQETKEEDTLSILHTVAAGLEREHGVRIEPAASEAAIELTRRFQPYRAFPGKAVTFLERATAEAAKTADEKMKRLKAGDNRPVVTRQFVVSAFARQTGLPEFILADHLTLDPAQVERHFSERLIGQPHAVETVVDLITIIKAGLNDPHKPLGCFFFVGPTGVGKTEMAKALAEYLFGSATRLMRFDISEYAEPFNVARLIGSAQGDNEGELTKRIRLEPFSVVLLDEFEKAHASIFDVMLQVLGEGRLTDAGGRTADFRSAIVLMTSNLGASPREQRKPGIRKSDTPEAVDTHFLSTMERFFRPEFINRIDKVVVFRPLEREAMRLIAARELDNLLAREGIARRRLLVEIDDAVIDLLLETGFSPLYGARPLKREIERRVIVPLARYLVAHRISTAQLIQIMRDGDGVQLLSTSLTAPKEKVKRAPSLLSAGSDGVGKMSFKELVEGFAAIRLRLHEWADGDTVREMQNEMSSLLAVTRRRKFVAYGPEAAKTWGRIYHLERITKRLNQLKERAEYLEEFATLVQRERNTPAQNERYQTELAQSYADFCRDVDYLEVELLCAHLQESSQALLRFRVVGNIPRSLDKARAADEPWAITLAKMYLRWAKRKGYEFEVLVPTEAYRRWIVAQGYAPKAHIPGFEMGPPVKPPWAVVKTSDFAELLRRLGKIETGELAIGVKGVNVYGFLKGEAGTHKLLFRDADTEVAAPVQTAVVQVESLAEDASAHEQLVQEWEEQQKESAAGARWKPSEVPPIVRVYAPDGDRHVRDLRTEVRTSLVKETLEGDLDAFILAYLKSEEAASAWDES